LKYFPVIGVQNSFPFSLSEQTSPITDKAKLMPCRFDVYWRIVFSKSCFCRVLDGGHFGQNMGGGLYGPEDHGFGGRRIQFDLSGSY